jgi:SNF family Na+-dependent transporter
LEVPYLIYTNGGGIFVLIFIILLFVIGIPCFYMETYFGQIFRRGPVETFGHIHKKFTGVGWAMVSVSWMLSLYYGTLLCWSYYFLFASFTSPLPWSNEGKVDKQGHPLPCINTVIFIKFFLIL